MPVLPQRWPWDVREASDLPTEVQRYLADTEVTALGGQVHEGIMIEPVATTVAGVVACLFLIANVPTNIPQLGDFLVVVMFVFIGRLGFKYWQWNRDLIFITSKRIIAVQGIITRRVLMMPLGKLTDMSYIRTPLGHVLNYGTFIVESAGQQQALSKLSPIPNPDASYRHVQNLLFGRPTGDVRLVDVTTEKKINVGWSGQITQKKDGADVTQDEDAATPWWKS